MTKGKRGAGGGESRRTWLLAGKVAQLLGDRLPTVLRSCKALYRMKWPTEVVVLSTDERPLLLQLTSEYCDLARAEGWETRFLPTGQQMDRAPDFVLTVGKGGDIPAGVVSRAVELGIPLVEASVVDGFLENHT